MSRSVLATSQRFAEPKARGAVNDRIRKVAERSEGPIVGRSAFVGDPATILSVAKAREGMDACPGTCTEHCY